MFGLLAGWGCCPPVGQFVSFEFVVVFDWFGWFTIIVLWLSVSFFVFGLFLLLGFDDLLVYLIVHTVGLFVCCLIVFTRGWMVVAWVFVICLLVVVSLFVLLFTVCDNGVSVWVRYFVNSGVVVIVLRCSYQLWVVVVSVVWHWFYFNCLWFALLTNSVAWYV